MAHVCRAPSSTVRDDQADDHALRKVLVTLSNQALSISQFSDPSYMKSQAPADLMDRPPAVCKGAAAVTQRPNTAGGEWAENLYRGVSKPSHSRALDWTIVRI
jgi:hypothetical protein